MNGYPFSSRLLPVVMAASVACACLTPLAASAEEPRCNPAPDQPADPNYTSPGIGTMLIHWWWRRLH
jgi:hypothetical protein